MNIAVRTTLMADKIKNLLDGNIFEGSHFTFVEKKGMEMIFSVSGDGAQTSDAAAIVKNAVKATDYGKALYFSVAKI